MIQTAILLSDPDISAAELAAVSSALQSQRLSGGPLTAEFESAFARYTGRVHVIAVSSGTLAMLLTFKAYGVAQSFARAVRYATPTTLRLARTLDAVRTAARARPPEQT